MTSTTALAQGDRVYLTEGARVGVETGERFEWGGRVLDWHVVGEGLHPDPLVDVIWTIEIIGTSHATMNGGGRDYQLRDSDTGIGATVRTTFQRGEALTMRRA